MMTAGNILYFIMSVVLLAAPFARGQSAATVTIQANQPGAVVSSNLFGIFFEEINFAGEGGIYAEMVRNRAFYRSDQSGLLDVGDARHGHGHDGVDPTQPLNTNIPNSLNLTMTSGTGSVGAGNAGFWGMSFQAGATYNLNFYRDGIQRFRRAGHRAVGKRRWQHAFMRRPHFSGLTTNWQRFSASLVSSSTDTNAQLVLSITNPGTVWLDVVSLFPAGDTFR